MSYTRWMWKRDRFDRYHIMGPENHALPFLSTTTTCGIPFAELHGLWLYHPPKEDRCRECQALIVREIVES